MCLDGSYAVEGLPLTEATVSVLTLKSILYRYMGSLSHTYAAVPKSECTEGLAVCWFKMQMTSPKFESMIQTVFF